MQRRWDVLGLGCATVDDLLYVDRYPAPEEKVRILRSERQCGGLTGTALVAAARYGASCAYGGQLGADELSRTVEDNFRKHGIDTSPVVREPTARPIHSTIIVSNGGRSRNIFFELAGPTGCHDQLPEALVIGQARVLFVDHYTVPGSLRAVAAAHAAGVATVADVERDEHPRSRELLAAVEHLLVSERFALRVTGAASAQEAARVLWSDHRRVAVVTCGERGCWYSAAADQVTHLPAFRVDVVDTTGCGDVFHGVYAATLAEGLDVAARLQRASAAAAAIKAMAPGGQRGIPDRGAVEAFRSAHLPSNSAASSSAP